MTILLHELRRSRMALLIWAGAISGMLAISILLYPEMASQMSEISDMFADMGSFSAAFGMDKVPFGEFRGYFSVECGNVLGLGGALFAALFSISALAKEERDRTAEFLLTHPCTRTRIVAEKGLAVAAQLAALNLITMAVALLSMLIIGETVAVDLFLLLFLAYFLMQVQIACICFGVSAFLRRNGLGLGIGLALLLYFVNLIANITEQAAVLKYVTPFAYADSASILSSGGLTVKYLLPGLAMAAAGVAAAFVQYRRKDIA